MPTRRVSAAACPTQTWNASHQAYADGANSGFVKASGPVAMRFFDKQLMPFSSSLAAHFPIGQRYFSSVLAQTYPNRRFLFAGTASGLTATNAATFVAARRQRHDLRPADTYGIDWAVHARTPPSALIVPGSARRPRAASCPMAQFYSATPRAGKLPQFTFLDPQVRRPPRRRTRRTSRSASEFVAERRQRADEVADVEQHRAVHQLRRRRRLLRPRAAAEGDQARRASRRSRSRARRRWRRAARPLRLPRRRCSSSPRTRAPTTSRTSSRTTPRSPPSSSASGTCRR